MMRIPFVKLRPAAIIPKQATPGSAGYDLYACPPEPYEFNQNTEITLDPSESVLIKTGIQIALPDNMYAQVCSRSGLALKQGVIVLNAPGIIDSDYRGEIGVILHNAGAQSTVVSLAKPIAQLVFANRISVNFDEITSEAMARNDTARGTGGFGSTSR